MLGKDKSSCVVCGIAVVLSMSLAVNGITFEEDTVLDLKQKELLEKVRTKRLFEADET